MTYSQGAPRRIDVPGLTPAGTYPEPHQPQQPTPNMRPAPQPQGYGEVQAPYVAPPQQTQQAQQAQPPVDHQRSDEVRLSKPYSGYNDTTIHVVRFRKPSTKDLRKAGYPMRSILGADGRVTAIDELPDVTAKYILLLSDPSIPPATLDQMDIDDFSRCSGAVLGFFLG